MSAAVEPPIFACEVEPDRERATVKAAGELDLATAEILDHEVRGLLDRGFRSLLLDPR